MRLFEEIDRTDQETPDYKNNGTFFEWIKTSSNPVPSRIRTTFELWFDHIVEGTEQKREKKGKIKGHIINSAHDDQIASAISEILFHELLTNVKCGTVTVEDETSDGTPDFHLENADNQEVYIEVFRPSIYLPHGEEVTKDNSYSLIREQFLLPISGTTKKPNKKGKVGKYKNLNKPYIVASNDPFSRDHDDIMQHLGFHLYNRYTSRHEPIRTRIQPIGESWDSANYPALINPLEQPHVSGLMFITGFLHPSWVRCEKGGKKILKWQLDDLSNAKLTLFVNYSANQNALLDDAFIGSFNLSAIQSDENTRILTGPLAPLLGLDEKWPFPSN